MDIICKNYNEADCLTKEANCRWAGPKRKCIRRDNVLAGVRYRYLAGGGIEIISTNSNSKKSTKKF